MILIINPVSHLYRSSFCTEWLLGLPNPHPPVLQQYYWFNASGQYTDRPNHIKQTPDTWYHGKRWCVQKSTRTRNPQQNSWCLTPAINCDYERQCLRNSILEMHCKEGMYPNLSAMLWSVPLDLWYLIWAHLKMWDAPSLLQTDAGLPTDPLTLRPGVTIAPLHPPVTSWPGFYP